MSLSPTRLTGSWYLGVLMVGFMMERLAASLWAGEPVYKGQSAGILLAFCGFAVAGILWIGAGPRQPAQGPLLAFLFGMGIAWVAHFLLYQAHGDAYNYTSWLYLPILTMLLLKPPSSEEAWSAVLCFAWAASVILVSVRLLEMTGILAIKYPTAGLIAWESERYFLPLNGVLGIEGRWPGPFGHTNDTAMIGAMILVVAFARWTKASWFFLPVGTITLLITNGRGGIMAAVAGLAILGVLTTAEPLVRIPRAIRLAAGLIVAGVFVIGFFFRGTGFTGREVYWPAFLELWRSSPIIGVGGSGIAVSGGVTQAWGHAHSMFVDELARYGLIGFITQFGALAIGLVIAIITAWQGRPAALAVLGAYLVSGLTDQRNYWITPTATGFLAIMAVMAAAADRQPRPTATPSPQSASP